MIENRNLILQLNTLMDLKEQKALIDSSIENNVIVALTLVANGHFKSDLDDEGQLLLQWLYELPILTLSVLKGSCSKDAALLFLYTDIRLGTQDLSLILPDEVIGLDLKKHYELLMGKGAEALHGKIESECLYQMNLINGFIGDDLLLSIDKYMMSLIADKSSEQIMAIMKCFKHYKKLGLSNNRQLLLEEEYIQFCNLIANSYMK